MSGQGDSPSTSSRDAGLAAPWAGTGMGASLGKLPYPGETLRGLSLDEAGRSDVLVARIPAAATGRAAVRPAYSCLDTSRYVATVGRPLPEWRDALRRYLRDAQPRPSEA